MRIHGIRIPQGNEDHGRIVSLDQGLDSLPPPLLRQAQEILADHVDPCLPRNSRDLDESIGVYWEYVHIGRIEKKNFLTAHIH
jgi:hypothetical protein